MACRVSSWLLILCVCSSVVTLVFGAQHLTVMPTDQTAVVGDTITFHCTVAEKKGFVTWLQGGSPLNFDTMMSTGNTDYTIVYSTTAEGEAYDLQITNVGHDDANTYECTVTQGGGDGGAMSGQVVLTVIAPQAFTTEPTNTDELEGNDVTLFCSVSNKAGQIVWSLDGEDISSDSTITTSTSGYTINSPIPSVDYNLKIESVRPEHAGNYVCSVTSANGHPAITSGTAVLTVELSPRTLTPMFLPTARQTFQTEPSDTTVVEGEATTLQCSVNNKHGTVSWKKGSDIISEDTTTTSHYAIVSTTPGFDYDLYIDNTTLDDSGDYECYVSDALNGDTAITSRSAILTVYDLEIQSFATTPSDAEVVEGNVIILQCTVDHKEGFVIWSKDGVDITNDATVTNGNPKYSVVGDVGNGEYHLQIDSVALSDAGTFKCQITEADNSPAIETAEVTLDVIGRQAFTDEPVDITAVEGDSVILTCSVSNKHGALSWIKDGDVINFDLNITNDDEHFSIMSTSPNTEYNLKIDNIQIRHEGSYICKVSDSVDGDSEIISQSAIVTVHDLESQNFTSSPVDAKIVEGNTLTLRCSVENKEGSVIWSKDNVDISTDHTVTNGDSRYSIRGNSDNGRYNLQIRDVALSDEGYYECRVTAADNSLEIKTPKAFIDVLRSICTGGQSRVTKHRTY
uniref:Obscurin-like n=1 Tax=Saccoglossus kowalevskii TaxID=10224 RepID=A0ABM0MP21_SACKO|nr:PREDICTED: obscurin-like [Saccoglossus kowalevskii]